MFRIIKRIIHGLTYHPSSAIIVQNGKPGWSTICVSCCNKIYENLFRGE